MKKIALFVLAQLLLSGMFVNAQKIVIKSGSLAFLNGQKTIQVKYDYSNMGVGKYAKEDDYIADKVASYNKDEAGKGDKWKAAWFDDRAKRYEPKFETLFNGVGKAKDLQCAQSAPDAKYEMIVHTTFIEPGFNVGISRRPAYINSEIKLVEIASGKEMALITMDKCPGRDAVGFDFDTGYRIEEGYAKMGKSLAAFFLKKM